ncbi:MAG: tetratricopeptide repeat protein [Gemmatimonadetes bacterium]|nr:tetratricopeptide repeat protein [Gemmatimonadota bacterium]
MTRALRGLAALTLLCTAPLAAQNPISDRMLNLQGKDAPDGALCKLQGGDFHIGSAATYLHSALAAPVVDNKRRLLVQGHDQALVGIQGGQAGSSKAWYFLGRIYLQQGDLVGADSAFTRTVQLAPACAAEVRQYRTRAYATLISAAAGHRTAGRADSAVYLARAAAQVDPDRPQSWYTIGTSFLDAQQFDSAAWYLEKTLASTGDSSANATTIRQAAAYQAAVVSYNKHDFTNAVRLFAEAVRLKSDDADAKRNLAASLRQAGMADSAAKVEATMMAAAAGSEGGLTAAQLFDIGVAQFNQHDFANAASTFEKIIAVEPYNRDALFNLAQSYNGSNNADKLLETALKLQAVDPLSYEVMQLVGQGYRAKHDQPNVLKAATALGGSTISVGITTFTVAANSATLVMKATGREGRDMNDRVVRGTPIPIVVEFLDKAGTVVATAEATVPALAPAATQDLTVTGTGAGITAWRYRRK